MFLLGFRRKLTALTLCKSIESAIQRFQIHHRITFATIQNPAVYLSGARVSIFSTLVPRLIDIDKILRVLKAKNAGKVINVKLRFNMIKLIRVFYPNHTHIFRP